MNEKNIKDAASPAMHSDNLLFSATAWTSPSGLNISQFLPRETTCYRFFEFTAGASRNWSSIHERWNEPGT